MPGEDVVLDDLQVVARRLDAARPSIQPSLGATRTDFGRQAIETIPQGGNAALNQVLQRAPGVVQDAFGNLTISRAIGRQIVSSEFNFSQADLDYIGQHWIKQDHDQRFTGSAGAAYTLMQGQATPLRLSADLLVGSGLRASASDVPNGRALGGYYTVNLSAVQKLDPSIFGGRGRGTELRVDVINLLDRRYLLRDGSGLGVGNPQYGLRRAILGGVTQRF